MEFASKIKLKKGDSKIKSSRRFNLPSLQSTWWSMIEVGKESIFGDHFRFSIKVYVIIQLDITSKTFVAEIIKLDIKEQGIKKVSCPKHVGESQSLKHEAFQGVNFIKQRCVVM